MALDPKGKDVHAAVMFAGGGIDRIAALIGHMPGHVPAIGTGFDRFEDLVGDAGVPAANSPARLFISQKNDIPMARGCRKTTEIKIGSARRRLVLKA